MQRHRHPGSEAAFKAVDKAVEFAITARKAASTLVVFFGLIGNGFDFPADTKEALRILELLRVAFQLLLVEGAKVRRAAIADEKGAEDNVHHLPAFSVDGSTGPHAVVLALIVADDAPSFTPSV